jgi:hypothetical protein
LHVTLSSTTEITLFPEAEKLAPFTEASKAPYASFPLILNCTLNFDK